MMYSQYLKAKQALMKRLVATFSDEYDYVSCLGSDIKGKSYRVNALQKQVNESGIERGFVIKMYKDKLYREFSFDHLSEENFAQLVDQIQQSNMITYAYQPSDTQILADEPLVKDFERIADDVAYSDLEIMEKLTAAKDKMMACDKIVNAIAGFSKYEVSKCFISKNRELTQHYAYYNLVAVAIARDDNNMQNAYRGLDGIKPSELFAKYDELVEETASVAKMLLKAKSVVPGVYDVITSPSISGLIAHEAFGHGVEMDMFVKNRALAKDYVGKQVASKIVSMHDGAASALNVASYFFDDDGVLASDTLIIDKGILVSGISDALSASVLKSKPTGNGRRESFSHKAYTRMTNTFFSPGQDKLADMIKSIDHGYILYDTNNGMEDPKNWGIQCTASYGLEIKDGELTGEVIAPVIISGYVPELLKSISMISDDFELSGAGMCGKGHKEWVRVSDGGPYMKARVKLG
ncbi:MAG: TldD/PmbA family protein [Erysipelotrichaceae bacterium]|nr:TldD/PmbA family protein [Erysipelotrichaceae bacterium]MDY5252174.1 TldD/PmbA family protein [Erysipelotrichaceae bacterium]